MQRAWIVLGLLVLVGCSGAPASRSNAGHGPQAGTAATSASATATSASEAALASDLAPAASGPIGEAGCGRSVWSTFGLCKPSVISFLKGEKDADWTEVSLVTLHPREEIRLVLKENLDRYRTVNEGRFLQLLARLRPQGVSLPAGHK